MHFRHVIVDRDGVLNHEPASGWVVDPREWEWEVGALDGLVLLGAAGVQISVATNQSCVARGVASRERVDSLNRWVAARAAEVGARIDRFLVCPHVDEDSCSCRKPKPGLVLEAIAASGVPSDETIVIGDAQRDLQAGLSAGVEVGLVRTGKGAAEESAVRASRVRIFDDLHDAARQLTGEAGR